MSNIYWPKPGSEDPAPKISYLKFIFSWNWVVGSDLYIDDLDALANTIFWSVMVVLLSAIVLSGVPGLFLTRMVSRPMHMAVDIIKNWEKATSAIA